MEHKVLTPIKGIAPLTGATSHATMTVHETHIKCSTPATHAASPRLARKGEVALRLPSAFMRTVGVPVESRVPGSDLPPYRTDEVINHGRGNGHRLSPSRFVSMPDTRRRTATRTAIYRSSYTLYAQASAAKETHG